MTKLEAMLKYVSEHNDFYKKRIKEYGITNPLEITQWPVLTREELQENRYNMFSDGYKTKYYSKLLKRQFSSGTSGCPINVYWDYNDYNLSMIPLWRRRLQYYGIRPSDKVVKFTMSVYNTNYSNKSIFNYMESPNVLVINRSCLQDEKKYEQLIKMLDCFSPKWLYIQPFILSSLLYYYQLFNVKPPLSLIYIESVGEVLSQKLKKDATAFFNVPVANMYGSEEMNCIAYECPQNIMHIMEDNVYIELQTSQNEEALHDGEILITNLNNRAMPLIRYNQADVVRVSKETCPCICGNHFSILEIIKGRSRESFNRENINVNTYLLIEIIDEVNNALKDIILQFQFSYSTSQDTLKCFLQLDSERILWKNIVEKSIKMAFEKKGILSLNFIFIYNDKNNVKELELKKTIFTVED